MYFILIIFHLFIFAVQANAVCFIKDTSSSPLSVLSSYSSATAATCRLECLKEAECIGISYTEPTGECFLHGSPLSTGSCSIPFEYLKKSTSGCQEHDVTAGFVHDSCLSRALLQPEYVTVGLDTPPQICPGLPVEGEAVARLWVVSVIFPNGTHQVYGNRKTLALWWDADRCSYAIRYIDQPLGVLDELVYAASCAYIKDDAANTCGCPATLPLESTAQAAYTNILPVRVAPLSSCKTGYKTRVFGVNALSFDSSTLFIRCRAGIWIFGDTPTASLYNSWTIVAGACYR